MEMSFIEMANDIRGQERMKKGKVGEPINKVLDS